MTDTTKIIKSDVQNKRVGTAIVAKQGDAKSRYVRVTMCRDGIEMPVPQSAEVIINAARPDGRSKAFFCTVNSDGTVTAPLTGWMLECAGVLRCSISVLGEGGEKLTSTTFFVDVEPAEFGGGAEEDKTLDVLAKLVVECRNAISEAGTAAGAASAAAGAASAAAGAANEAAKAANAVAAAKLDKSAVVQTTGQSADKVMSQKAITDALATKANAADIEPKLDEVLTTVTGIDGKVDKLLGAKPKLYGYRVKITEPNPDTRVEYILDAVGMKPAKMDFAQGTFDYGDWKDVWFVRDNYPVMLKYDGTEDYRLDPSDYGKKAKDGTDSDVASLEYAGNAMSAIPLCWVKRYQEGNYQYVIFCETKYDDGFEAYAHTRADGTVAPYAYHAIYKGTINETKLRSISGTNPGNNTGAQAEIDAAEANGTGYTIRTWSLQNLIADLCTLISKSTNSEAAFGQGETSGYVSDAAQNYSIVKNGTLDTKGQFWGTNANTTSAVKVFHIENFWGARWDRLVGWIYRNGVNLVKMTPEGGGYNLTGDGYVPVGTGMTGAASGSGYQHLTEQTEYGKFPAAPLNGSDATYECDGFWWNNGITAVALAGGNCGDGAGCGSRCLSVNSAATVAHWSFGASLSCLSSS